MEFNELILPGHYWHYYSTSNLFEIPHLISKTKKKVFADEVMFLKPMKELEMTYLTEPQSSTFQNISEYRPMSKFPDEMRGTLIKTIFINTKIKKF